MQHSGSTLYQILLGESLNIKGGTRLRNCRDTALQTGRSRDRFPMVSLEFFIDIILSAALWPWGLLYL
jgi:hypothetical protein